MLIANRAIVFDCDADRLVGIVSEPVGGSGTVGVIVIVGGPQYRVGSHRQFTLLARHLADQGVPTFRFDYRGMGDSEGVARTFDQVDADIKAAIDAFLRNCPRLTHVVLWGLCDGASAALMYAPADPRVRGLVLANPWVRSEQTQAAAVIKRYYGPRLRSAAFWRKFAAGDVNLLGAAAAFATSAIKAFRKRSGERGEVIFQDRMLEGWQRAAKPTLLLLSGNDLTAQEFNGLTAGNAAWQRCLVRAEVQRVELTEADHTFSTAKWRGDVENAVSAWIARLP